jgi:hypothetical protein
MSSNAYLIFDACTSILNLVAFCRLICHLTSIKRSCFSLRAILMTQSSEHPYVKFPSTSDHIVHWTNPQFWLDQKSPFLSFLIELPIGLSRRPSDARSKSHLLLPQADIAPKTTV